MHSLRREGNCERRPTGEGDSRGDRSNLQAEREENFSELRRSPWNEVDFGWSFVMRLTENIQQPNPDSAWSKWEVREVLSRMELIGQERIARSPKWW